MPSILKCNCQSDNGQNVFAETMYNRIMKKSKETDNIEAASIYFPLIIVLSAVFLFFLINK